MTGRNGSCRLALAQLVFSRLGQVPLSSADCADSAADKIGNLLWVEFPLQQQLLDLLVFFMPDQVPAPSVQWLVGFDGLTQLIRVSVIVGPPNGGIGDLDAAHTAPPGSW